MQTDVLFNADGAITGLSHRWTFDEMYSSMATYDLDANGDGKLDRAELQSLADINIQSMNEFNYFTHIRAGERAIELAPPRDYWLEHRDELLTLHMTTDLKTPLTRDEQDQFSLRIYDRVNYVSFKFAADAPLKLVGAAPDCVSTISLPEAKPSAPLSEAFFDTLDPNADIGAQYASTAKIGCGAVGEALLQQAEAAPENVAGLSTPTISPLGIDPTVEEDAAALSAAATAYAEGEQDLWARLRQMQTDFYGKLADAVRGLKQENPWLAGLTLAFFSFVYGVVHAAGPGHGKAVIASYVLANERTLRRGVILAVIASFAQAVTAIAMVGVFVVALKAANVRVEALTANLETVSFALVALLGAWMLIAALRRATPAPAPLRAHSLSAAAAPAHHHARPYTHHDHGPNCGCGHSHAPDPAKLQGDLSLRKAAAIVLAIGIRPCTGAILVLVFALSQGLWWAGVASTFAMAAGTAITVSALAVLAVGSRNLAVRLTGGAAARRIETGAAIMGSLLLMTMGVVFFIASLGPSKPFGG
jgi:ABC-type nickel/cobalt efflux system permease component RcnA/ABC-type uncharacterized transport system substrate-binding protein